MKEPFKFFRPWEDKTPSAQFDTPILIYWQLVPTTSTSYPSLMYMPDIFSKPPETNCSTASPPPLSTTALPPTKRLCVRCKCAFCRMRKAGELTSAKPVHICDFPECGKTYRKTSHLKAHLRSHIGSRPFECHWWQCGKKFSRSDQLQRHLRAHTGERRHVCSICGRSFARSDHLKQHQSSQHSTDDQPVGNQ